MELTISDLANHLGVSPDTIERWLRQGKLPASRSGATVSFKFDDLKKWALNNNINFKLSEKTENKAQIETGICLSDAISQGGVYFDISADSIDGTLKGCLEKITSIPDQHKESLFEQLMERELALSTGIGNGFAIPHPRQQQEYLEAPLVCVCFLKDPVDYNALDSKPVTVLFLILCPDLKLHLHLLSALSGCLRDFDFIQFINTQPSQDDLIKRIKSLQQANS